MMRVKEGGEHASATITTTTTGSYTSVHQSSCVRRKAGQSMDELTSWQYLVREHGLAGTR